jgi:hypothetical protein
VSWRGAILEPSVAGLPVRTADAVILATEKALYRVPYPGRDGEVEVLAAIPRAGSKGEPLPAPGNLALHGDLVLSASNDGILCFGPAR